MLSLLALKSITSGFFIILLLFEEVIILEKTVNAKEGIFSIKKIKSVNSMVKLSLLSVLAYIFMIIEFPVPLFPSFLKLDLSDLPALVGAFSFGPLAGVIIEFIKNLLHVLTMTKTGGVGELANFLVGCALVVPASSLYLLKRKRSYALYGMLLGTIVMAIVGGVMNYYVLIPFYAKMMPMEQIINLGNAVNGAITDLKTLILYSIVPFNIFKGVIISVITGAIYKKISYILR